MSSTWSREKYIKALKYAAEAHKDQLFPGTTLPYVVHVTMVAMEIIAALAYEENQDGDLAIQCALLHDVIEDTGISYERLSIQFGKEVAEGVLALTKSNLLKSKQDKIADSIARIKQQPKEVWMVKLADRITNLQPPPKKWYKIDGKIGWYREEAEKILHELGSASEYLSERFSEKLLTYPGHNEAD